MCPEKIDYVHCVAQCKGIRIPESGKFLHVESGILETFACGIRNPGPWNPEYSCQNPESPLQLESGIQVPLYKIWRLVIGIRNPRRGIQNPRLSWIPLHGARRGRLRIRDLT